MLVNREEKVLKSKSHFKKFAFPTHLEIQNQISGKLSIQIWL